jgi:hypothetical protein
MAKKIATKLATQASSEAYFVISSTNIVCLKMSMECRKDGQMETQKMEEKSRFFSSEINIMCTMMYSHLTSNKNRK